MSILKNLKKMHAAIIAQRIANDESPLGIALNNAAVQACLGGLGSEPWRRYMAVFADNPEQLTRLAVKNPQGEPTYLPQMRAYIVSNAICDAHTNGHTDNRVTEQIDGVPGPGTADPLIPEAPSDPGGEIAKLRPDGLKSIPDVQV